MRSIQKANIAAVGTFLTCAFMATTSVHANTFCADTPTALRQALAAASDDGVNNHENNTIKIVRGTYATEGAEFYFNSTDPHTLDINGGYNQDCTTLIENPALTILDGSSASRAFESESTQGDVSLRFLTFQNGFAPDNALGGGLLMNESTADAGPVIVDQNIFRNNHAIFEGGGFVIITNGTGTIQFENNLVVGNSADYEYGGGALADNGGAGATIINNTITQNTVTNLPLSNIGGLYIRSADALKDTMSNSIVYGNTGYDLQAVAVLVANDCGANVDMANFSSVDNVVVDPKFVGAGDYHLSGDSPLLGLGDLTPVGGLPSIDIVGLPRQFNGLVDMGAYEHGNEIFKDGFNN